MKLFNNIYLYLSLKEKNGRKIGLFRSVLSVFGALLLSYLLMALSIFISPLSLGYSFSLALILHFIVWACFALWIIVSPSKMVALKRVLVPSIIFSILLMIMYKV